MAVELQPEDVNSNVPVDLKAPVLPDGPLRVVANKAIGGALVPDPPSLDGTAVVTPVAAVPPAVRIEPASLSLLVEPLAELTRAVRDLERSIALLNTVIPSSYASVAQLAEHQTEYLQVPSSNRLGVIGTSVGSPQAGGRCLCFDQGS